jgi:cellulose synthase/poly-beta-1,6-N-acetylglucosamine synthase-like glycosyltransferase
MNFSLIITAWKEPETVRDTLLQVLDANSGNMLEDLEIIVVCPDEETKAASMEVIKEFNFGNFVHIKDPQKGKPFALNMALKQARGKILIFTDGDVIIQPQALPALVKPLQDDAVGLVTGRPISADSKRSMFGYFGNLLADVAHVKRLKEFGNGGFYFVSGYLYAMRNIEGFQVPVDTLVDDAWVTLQFVKKGEKIAYSPNALVKVKYPKSMSEWVKQKKRSMGGYNIVSLQRLMLNFQRHRENREV